MAAASDTAYDRYRATARFPSIDGLRCLSIVPVFWHHCTLGPLPGVLGRGPLGVDLFFVISGFLITTLLLRERDERGRVSMSAFYARRSLRIFPLYYGVLLLYVLNAGLWMAHGPQRDHFFRSLPFFATYTTNWFVDFAVPHPVSFAFAWSLAAEEQFYLVWPWVVGGALASSGSTARWFVPALVSLGLLGLDQGVEHGLWLDALPAASLGRRMVGSIASPICMGALLGLALHARAGFAAVYVALGQRASAVVTLVVLVLCACLDGVPLWFAELAMTFLVGACSVRLDHSLTWLLEQAWVRWVGTVSYGLYLFHVGLITFARRVLPDALATPGWTLLLVFPVTVGLASASYVAIERPLLRLRPRG